MIVKSFLSRFYTYSYIIKYYNKELIVPQILYNYKLYLRSILMKKIVVLSMLTATIIHATNGDNMIGVGVQSRAMGGAGVGMGMGTDSVFRNPAWIVDQKGFNASFGATLFMPTVSAKVGPAAGLGNGQSAESTADMSIIPTVSHSNHINENLSYGIGMFGVSGMGVDYRNEDPQKGLANMRTSLQYMRFVPSISYKTADWRFGAGLTLAYGALSMSALTPNGVPPGQQPDPTTATQRGGGLSEDIGFGAQFGVGYYVTEGITVGAYYQSEVATEYEEVFDFTTNGQYDDLKLSQPAEVGIGIGYVSDCKCYSLTLDYRRIMWSDADGYDEFQWDDQDVISLGGSYNVNSALVLRAGYNYAKSPLNDKTFKAANVGGAPFQGFNVAYFNTLGFPAYSESHITAGLSYQINKTTGIDLAYVYSPEVTEKSMQVLEASNEQNSISAALKFTF
jgi:long-chain fatty acid transport protein